MWESKVRKSRDLNNFHLEFIRTGESWPGKVGSDRESKERGRKKKKKERRKKNTRRGRKRGRKWSSAIVVAR